MPGHVAASRDGQPGGQLADQAKPEHHDLRPGTYLGQAQAVQRDRGDRGERRVLGGHAVRDRGAEQAGHRLEFRVVGLAGAAGRHQLAGPEPGDRGSGLEHDARGGVAERQVLGEPAADRLPGGGQAVGPGLADHLADQVRAGAGLGQQAGLGQRGHCPLGARRDHRCDGADQHLGRLRDRAAARRVPRPGRLPAAERSASSGSLRCQRDAPRPSRVARLAGPRTPPARC